MYFIDEQIEIQNDWFSHYMSNEMGQKVTEFISHHFIHLNDNSVINHPSKNLISLKISTVWHFMEWKG